MLEKKKRRKKAEKEKEKKKKRKQKTMRARVLSNGHGNANAIESSSGLIGRPPLRRPPFRLVSRTRDRNIAMVNERERGWEGGGSFKGTDSRIVSTFCFFIFSNGRIVKARF